MDIEQIDDLATAKRVMRAQQSRVKTLTEQLLTLTARVALLEGKSVPEQIAIELANIQEQLANANQRLFGDSSEKRPSDKEPVDKAPQRGHGPNEQRDLARVDHYSELAEGDHQCGGCGEKLTPIKGMTEDSSYVTVVPAQYIVVNLQRQKYRCKNECSIVTAPNVAKAREGGSYSVEFAAHVAISKYLDHLPLERQARMMKRAGLVVTSQTLWDQIEAVAEILQPTYDAMREYVLSAEVVGVDETHWRLMGNKRSTKKYWAWGITREDACWYQIRDSRSTDAAAEVLANFSGTALVDGYVAYESLANREGIDIVLANCWAHVRRKFVEAEQNYPGPCGEALDMIGELFAIERELPKLVRLTDEEKAQALEVRAKVRSERSAPLVEKLRAWAVEQRGLPKGGLRKAIEYMLKLWTGLTTFLKDPRVEIHNNGTERALRGMVIGRKNHYGSRSVRGTEVAALRYTLVESAKLSGVNPEAYLIAAIKCAMETPGAVLLPKDFE